MNKKTAQIVWFEEVGKGDVGLVGGKGANLGEMITAQIPVPYGFIVTAHAYFHFIHEANLQQKIKNLLAPINYDDPDQLQQVCAHVRELIMKADMPSELAKQIIRYYEDLPSKQHAFFQSKSLISEAVSRVKSAYRPTVVAVRSSATAEDLPTASFAGQQETYLNVVGEHHLLNKVKECWASLFTERAVFYRHSQGFDHFRVGLAAVVQRMVESDKSGIAFSIDPVTNDKSKIVIEAIFGLGEYIVQGKVTPDHYEVDKRSLVITKLEVKRQEVKYVRWGLGNKEATLSASEGKTQKLTNMEIEKVALLVQEIEKHYFFPQDIEWAIEDGQTFIVQSRPITTIHDHLSKKGDSIDLELAEKDKALQHPIVTGAPASPGVAVGTVATIHSPKEIDKVKKGDILVAPQTNPDYVPAMKRAAGIVTDKGGRTSHAAIVSRELGIPAVVGAEGATAKLKTGMMVSVNGTTGEVFKGSVLSPSLHEKKEIASTSHTHRAPRTLTKIYVNLAEPDEAKKVAAMDVDGIGLLRAEFMIADIGKHPKQFIKEGKQDQFINLLSAKLLQFAHPFNPRPIVYRATDFKTNEYRNLKGGKLFEPKEENPMLGFRGASRYIANPDVFGMELEAIAKVWRKGYRNVHLMIPFVRTPWELIRIKQIIGEYGLFSLPGFKLLIMVEVPACAIQLEDFIAVGIDGVSIGTNDLTMMLMGVDRDNQDVSLLYDERNPAVVGMLEYIVKTCTEHKVTCSICGQAASDYPDLVTKLVRAGITSVSVNPDAVDRTRQSIHTIEKELFESLRVTH